MIVTGAFLSPKTASSSALAVTCDGCDGAPVGEGLFATIFSVVGLLFPVKNTNPPTTNIANNRNVLYFQSASFLIVNVASSLISTSFHFSVCRLYFLT